MSVIGLDHYNLRGTREQLESLREFYKDVLGLTDGDRPTFNSFGYWLYAGERAILHLSESTQEETPLSTGGSSFNHAAFRCSGRQDFEEKLEGMGIGFSTGHVPGTAIVQLFFSDPAGNGVELSFTD